MIIAIEYPRILTEKTPVSGSGKWVVIETTPQNGVRAGYIASSGDATPQDPEAAVRQALRPPAGVSVSLIVKILHRSDKGYHLRFDEGVVKYHATHSFTLS